MVKALNTDNIGNIVHVVRRYQGPLTMQGYGPDDVVWQVDGTRPMTWVYPDRVSHDLTGPVPDACLRPIRAPGAAPQPEGARQDLLAQVDA